MSSLLIGSLLVLPTLPSATINEKETKKISYETRRYSSWKSIKTKDFQIINSIDDFLNLELKITKKSGIETQKVHDLLSIKNFIDLKTGTSSENHWAKFQININDQIDNIVKIELIQGYKNDKTTNILDLTEVSKNFLKEHLKTTNIVNKLVYDFDLHVRTNENNKYLISQIDLRIQSFFNDLTPKVNYNKIIEQVKQELSNQMLENGKLKIHLNKDYRILNNDLSYLDNKNYNNWTILGDHLSSASNHINEIFDNLSSGLFYKKYKIEDEYYVDIFLSYYDSNKDERITTKLFEKINVFFKIDQEFLKDYVENRISIIPKYISNIKQNDEYYDDFFVPDKPKVDEIKNKLTFQYPPVVIFYSSENEDEILFINGKPIKVLNHKFEIDLSLYNSNNFLIEIKRRFKNSRTKEITESVIYKKNIEILESYEKISFKVFAGDNYDIKQQNDQNILEPSLVWVKNTNIQSNLTDVFNEEGVPEINKNQGNFFANLFRSPSGITIDNISNINNIKISKLDPKHKTFVNNKIIANKIRESKGNLKNFYISEQGIWIIEIQNPEKTKTFYNLVVINEDKLDQYEQSFLNNNIEKWWSSIQGTHLQQFLKKKKININIKNKFELPYIDKLWNTYINEEIHYNYNSNSSFFYYDEENFNYLDHFKDLNPKRLTNSMEISMNFIGLITEGSLEIRGRIKDDILHTEAWFNGQNIEQMIKMYNWNHEYDIKERNKKYLTKNSKKDIVPLFKKEPKIINKTKNALSNQFRLTDEDIYWIIEDLRFAEYFDFIFEEHFLSSNPYLKINLKIKDEWQHLYDSPVKSIKLFLPFKNTQLLDYKDYQTKQLFKEWEDKKLNLNGLRDVESIKKRINTFIMQNINWTKLNIEPEESKQLLKDLYFEIENFNDIQNDLITPVSSINTKQWKVKVNAIFPYSGEVSFNIENKINYVPNSKIKDFSEIENKEIILDLQNNWDIENAIISILNNNLKEYDLIYNKSFMIKDLKEIVFSIANNLESETNLRIYPVNDYFTGFKTLKIKNLFQKNFIWDISKIHIDKIQLNVNNLELLQKSIKDNIEQQFAKYGLKYDVDYIIEDLYFKNKLLTLLETGPNITNKTAEFLVKGISNKIRNNKKITIANRSSDFVDPSTIKPKIQVINGDAKENRATIADEKNVEIKNTHSNAQNIKLNKDKNSDPLVVVSKGVEEENNINKKASTPVFYIVLISLGTIILGAIVYFVVKLRWFKKIK